MQSKWIWDGRKCILNDCAAQWSILGLGRCAAIVCIQFYCVRRPHATVAENAHLWRSRVLISYRNEKNKNTELRHEVISHLLSNHIKCFLSWSAISLLLYIFLPFRHEEIKFQTEFLVFCFFFFSIVRRPFAVSSKSQQFHKTDVHGIVIIVDNAPTENAISEHIAEHSAAADDWFGRGDRALVRNSTATPSSHFQPKEPSQSVRPSTAVVVHRQRYQFNVIRWIQFGFHSHQHKGTLNNFIETTDRIRTTKSHWPRTDPSLQDSNHSSTASYIESVIRRRIPSRVRSESIERAYHRLSLNGTSAYAGHLSSMVFSKIKSLWNTTQSTNNAGLNQLATGTAPNRIRFINRFDLFFVCVAVWLIWFNSAVASRSRSPEDRLNVRGL